MTPPPFTWPVVTVLRGPVLVGTYPPTLEPSVAWDGTVVGFDWPKPQRGWLWTIHPIAGMWYAAPCTRHTAKAWQVAIPYGTLHVVVDQWPMTNGWAPETGDPIGLMVVGEQVRTPIYWQRVNEAGLTTVDAQVWERAAKLPRRARSWLERTSERLREWA